MPQVKPHIAAMSPYSPPWTGLDRSAYLRLDLNENSLDPPDHVIRALKSCLDRKGIQMYPEYFRFLPKLAAYAQVGENQIILSNGSDQAIEIILRAFLGPGDTMLMAEPGFPIFNQVAGVIGAKVHGVPYDKELHFPCEAFLDAITADTNLVVVINPDNPTGSSLSLSRIRDILEKAGDIPVIADEAYFEYTGVTALALLSSYPNLIITRTFSKAFAMAGLRLGYAIASPELIAEFHKIRGPFDINSCAVTAAGAQLDDPHAWKAYVVEIMQKAKPFLENFFTEKGVKYYPGAAHFMLVQPENRDEAVAFLKEQGILVRPMTAPLIRRTFRMNAGTLEQTKKFADAYQKYLNR
ncbi:MAG: histidinol-phosphate transaminase [Desulfococcaceae bacterium]|nr:histidinol-phosphate transaminase [Desulfococcaceae bacterium]